jgi:enoyl-CoA hydratase/carnithine racemase
MQDLAGAMAAARDDSSVRAVVLTGDGPFFSGGFDLHGEGNMGADPVAVWRLFRESLMSLFTFPKPTVAMMGGHAIAGGLVLVLACDYRLGLDGDYRIGLNEVAIGASFPRAAFEITRLRLTHQQASELILGASIYPASQALRLGVVDELFPADKFESTVMRRAARLGAYPREAYAYMKAEMIAEAVARVEAETVDETAEMAAIWVTPESMAARDAQRRKLKGD